MTKTSDNIKYSPSLSIAENAKRNGVNEDAIRYYIRTRGIDRRYEEKKRVLKDMKAYLKEHPNATKAEVARRLYPNVDGCAFCCRRCHTR